MARVGLQETVEGDRSKTFSLDGRLFNHGAKPFEVPMPGMPPKEMVFNLMFFRSLFDDIVKTRPSLVTLRNLSYTIMVVMQLEDPQTVNFFGNIKKKKIQWKDMLRAVVEKGHPRVELTTVERIFITLDIDETSRLAKFWFHLIMVVTVANVTVFICPWSFTASLVALGVSEVGWYAVVFKNTCMTVFSIDYLVKMACVPFVRLEVVDPCVEFFDINTWTNRPMLPGERLLHFGKQSSNVIDLLAILPWWCDLAFGHLLPAASFLRILRLARVFRIFKSVRHMDMMQVLGLTLWKSTSMVAIVFAMITIIGLIASCLLQQLEHDEKAFDTVMSSWYWTFCRLIGMKDTPGYSGKVFSVWGIMILGCTLTLKGVLWIVPIERIKQIFSKEYADVVSSKNLQHDVMKEVKEILEGVHEDVESMLKDGPAGYACALLTVGAYEQCIPLPISKKKVFDNTGQELTVEMGEMWMQVRFKWTPSEEMEALPSGKLSVQIVDAKVPALSDITLEVLVGHSQKEEKTIIFNDPRMEATPKELTFDIHWPASKVTSSKTETLVQHQVHDLDEFQVQVMHLLQEQEDMIQEQQKMIESQSEQLASMRTQVQK